MTSVSKVKTLKKLKSSVFGLYWLELSLTCSQLTSATFQHQLTKEDNDVLPPMNTVTFRVSSLNMQLPQRG